MFTARIPNKGFEKFHVLLKLEVGSKYQALMRGFFIFITNDFFKTL